MIRLLRNNTLVSFVAIVALLMGMASFLYAIGNHLYIQADITPFASILISIITPKGIFGNFLLALLLILAQSILFGILAERNQLLYKSTYLPALFYGLFSMIYPDQLRINPELLASTFLLLAVMFLFFAQGARQAFPALFNSGAFGALAFLISPTTLLFIPVFLFGILSFKPARGVDFAQFLCGYVLVIFFAVTWLYWQGNTESIENYIAHLRFAPNWGADWHDWNMVFLVTLLGITLVPTFFRLQQNFFRNTIRVRKLQGFLLVYLIFGLIYSLLGAPSLHTAGTLLALPFAVFFTYFFLSDKRKIIRESIFLLFVLAIVAQHLRLF